MYGIYKFGNNTYPRRIRRRSNLGHIFRGGKKVHHMGREIRYMTVPVVMTTVLCTPDDGCKGHPKHVNDFAVQ